jgi:hypothetical protein
MHVYDHFIRSTTLCKCCGVCNLSITELLPKLFQWKLNNFKELQLIHNFRQSCGTENFVTTAPLIRTYLGNLFNFVCDSAMDRIHSDLKIYYFKAAYIHAFVISIPNVFIKVSLTPGARSTISPLACQPFTQIKRFRRNYVIGQTYFIWITGRQASG